VQPQKKGTLFNFTFTNPLVVEPAFTQDLYDGISTCVGGYSPLTWHPLGYQPNFVGQTITLKFYDMTTSAPLTGGDIVLTNLSSTILTPTTWNNIVAFTNIHYNGSVAGQSLFTIKALYSPGVGMPYIQLTFDGTTCIPSNCTPPPAQICKPTQQALEVQNFLTGVLSDYSLSSPSWFDLGSYTVNAAQYFTALVRYPFGTAVVNTSGSPITHSVSLSTSSTQIIVQGQNPTYSGGITVTYNFAPTSANPGATLNGALGFNSISPNQGTGPYDFTIKALYPLGVTKVFEVTVSYSGGICGNLSSDPCRKYVFGSCSPFVPSQCNNNQYNTTVQLQSLLNEIKNYPLNTPSPLAGLSNYGPLLQSQVGATANTFVNTINSTYNSTLNITTYTLSVVFQNVPATAPTTVACTANLTFTTPGTPVTINPANYTFSGITILGPPSSQFSITATSTSGSFNLLGEVACLQMQNCEPCAIMKTIFKEDFDSYNSTNAANALLLNFETEVFYPPVIPTPISCLYSGFNVCDNPVPPTGNNFRKFSVINGNSCTGFADHTNSVNRNFLYSIFRVPSNSPNPPLPIDYMDVWKTKTGSNIPTTVGTLYDISFYYRSHFDAGFTLELVVDNGTTETVIASKVVFPIVNQWTLMQGSWSANASSMKVKVRTRPFLPPGSPGNYSWFNYIAVDDIAVKEQECENEAIYPLPVSIPEDDCQDQLTNIALSNASQQYALYIDDIKKDFVERYNKKCQESLERMQATYSTTEGHYTLYYYDQGGNLIKTVPPEGVELINLSAPDPITGLTFGNAIKQDRLNKTRKVFTKHRMATKYEYNSLNQLIRQQLPDHENMDNWATTNNTGIAPTSQVMAMDFADNSKGYMVGNDGAGNGVIYITNNGGASWSTASAVGLANIIDIDISGSDAIGILSDGSLIKSSNYTSTTPTWVSISLPGSSLMQFTDITFNGLDGYITGKNGLLLKTTDGGATWNSVILGTSANLNKVILSGNYGIIVGDAGTLFYINPTITSWASFSLINPGINITNATIISTGNSVTTFMNVMLTGNDVSVTPVKGTVIDVKNVDDFSTATLNAIFSITSTNNSNLNAITSNAYIVGSSNFNDVYVGGVINAGPDTPVLYKLQSVTSSAYTPTALSITPALNTAVTSLKVNDYGNSASEVHGTLKNGKFLYINGTTIKGYDLAGTGTAINANQVNNVWVDPSSISSGIIAGNGGTIIKYSSANTTTVTSSSLNSIIFSPLNSVTAAKDGSGKVYAVGDNGAAVYSTNSGTSWQFVTTGLSNNLYSALYLQGANKVAIGGNGGYINTIDATTNLITSPPINNPATTTVYRHILRDPNNAAMLFLSGTANGTNALIEKCTFTSPNVPVSIGALAGGPLNKLVFTNNLTAYAVGDGGTIIKSTNSGVSFGPAATLSGPPNNLKDISFTDQFTGYALGTGGIVYKTTDAGANWIQKPASATGNINAVYNFGNGQLLAAGAGAPNLQNINDQSSDYSTRFLYDALGRLVVSQNSKQFNKSNKAYSYTIYDAIGRISQVGEIAGGSIADPFTLTTGNGIIDLTVLNSWLTTGTKTEVTSTVYDIAVTTNPCGFVQDNLRKRVSATYLDTDDNLSNGYQHASYYTYDIHGNVSTLFQENPNMPAGHTCKRIDYEYDLISGKVNKVAYQTGQMDAYFHTYDYDADNRITNVYTSKDGFNWQQDAKYFYYLHGPLARTEIGEDKVQGMDYAYTLQGWIKGINSTILDENNDIGKDGANGTLYNSTLSDLNKHISKDAASYSLNYFKDDYIAIDGTKNTATNRFDAGVTNNPHMSVANNWLYNGNISAMVTTIHDFTGGPPGVPSPQLSGYRYDQLNRINDIRTYKNITANAWNNVAAGNEYRNEFTYDANGNIMNQKRYNDAGVQLDDMDYKYQTDGTGKKYANRLYHVNDNTSFTALAANDIDDQGTFTAAPAVGNTLGMINVSNNYVYDAIGNLVKDKTEDISQIEWTVYGKIKQIDRTSTNTTDYNHKFEYDAMGNRVEKTIYKNGTPSNQWETTYYVRDAQGNVMATYEYEPVASVQTLYLVEHPVYGSSRVGLQNYLEKDNLAPTSTYNTSGAVYAMNMQVGNKSYEISNHLGNVITVVSDKKIPVQGSPGVVSSYTADIIAATDYYSFGMVMENRDYSNSDYRYGFNGKENDTDVKGKGNQQDYGMRVYDSRLGRFMSVDPASNKYPMLTTFQFSANQPITSVDIDGLEADKDLNPTQAPDSKETGTDAEATEPAKNPAYKTPKFTLLLGNIPSTSAQQTSGTSHNTLAYSSQVNIYNTNIRRAFRLKENDITEGDHFIQILFRGGETDWQIGVTGFKEKIHFDPKGRGWEAPTNALFTVGKNFPIGNSLFKDNLQFNLNVSGGVGALFGIARVELGPNNVQALDKRYNIIGQSGALIVRADATVVHAVTLWVAATATGNRTDANEHGWESKNYSTLSLKWGIGINIESLKGKKRRNAEE
jgi:RHS repeat-associated protein